MRSLGLVVAERSKAEDLFAASGSTMLDSKTLYTDYLLLTE